jgi:hypothetical protein
MITRPTLSVISLVVCRKWYEAVDIVNPAGRHQKRTVEWYHDVKMSGLRAYIGADGERLLKK